MLSTEEECSSSECEWIEDNNSSFENEKNGVCVIKDIRNFICSYLSKNVCNKYVNTNNLSYMSNITITIDDGPCFFNGDNERSCIVKSSLKNNDCNSIKTNDIIFYEGKEVESCSDANIIFGWTRLCIWIEKDNSEKGGICSEVYYLTKNGINYFILFYFCYLFIYLFTLFTLCMYLFIYLFTSFIYLLLYLFIASRLFRKK
jgi:hypothetical protein